MKSGSVRLPSLHHMRRRGWISGSERNLSRLPGENKRPMKSNESEKVNEHDSRIFQQPQRVLIPIRRCGFGFVQHLHNPNKWSDANEIHKAHLVRMYTICLHPALLKWSKHSVRAADTICAFAFCSGDWSASWIIHKKNKTRQMMSSHFKCRECFYELPTQITFFATQSMAKYAQNFKVFDCMQHLKLVDRAES